MLDLEIPGIRQAADAPMVDGIGGAVVGMSAGTLTALFLALSSSSPDASSAPHPSDPGREHPSSGARVDGDTITDPFAERVPGYQTTLRYLQALVPRRDRPEAGSGGDEVEGLNLDLVIDETQSHMGREFFDAFFTNWERPEGTSNATIRVQEFLVPSVGTRVAVLIDGEELFQLQLQPDSETIRELGRQAAMYVQQELGERPGLFEPAPGRP